MNDNIVRDDNPPEIIEDSDFLDQINAECAARDKAKTESRAAREELRRKNKAKLARTRRIHWWLGLFHWIVHYAGCACAIFCALMFGLPHGLAIVASVLTLAELVWISRRLAQTRPRKDHRNG